MNAFVLGSFSGSASAGAVLGFGRAGVGAGGSTPGSAGNSTRRRTGLPISAIAPLPSFQFALDRCAHVGPDLVRKGG